MKQEAQTNEVRSSKERATGPAASGPQMKAQIKRSSTNRLSIYLVVALLLGVGEGCVSSRLLPEGEKLLHSQRIKNTKGLSLSDVEGHLSYQRNRRLFFAPWWLPYVEIYEMGRKRYNKEKYPRKIEEISQKYDQKIKLNPSKKESLQRRKNKQIDRMARNIREGNLWMRIGRPLSLYSEKATSIHVERLGRYLRQEGYFQAQVVLKKREKGQRIYLSYELHKGLPYHIDSLSYHIASLPLDSALEDFSLHHMIEKTARYEQKDLEEAQAYTYNYILDQGFYGFDRDRLRFVVDTSTLKGRDLWLQLHIESPPQGLSDRRYKVDTIALLVSPRKLGTNYSHHYKGLFFNTNRYHRVLSHHLFIQPGAYYKHSQVEQSRQMMSRLDIFQYTDIYQDTLKDRLHTQLHLHKHKRYDFFQEAGFDINQGGLPSPSLTLGLKARDLLGALEVIELSARFSVNGISNPSQRSQPYRGYEASVQGILSYPGIFFPFVWLPDQVSLSQKSTLLRLGLYVSDRSDYQRYHNIFSSAYEWKTGNQLYYKFTFLNIDLVSALLSRQFVEQIQQLDNSLSNSFRSTISSSISFQLNWNHNYTGFSPRAGQGIRFLVENGGHLNSLYRDFAQRSGLEQYVFSKASLEYVHSVPTSVNSNLVWRLRMGAAIPHGDNKSLPYEKYFFLGGSNSVRAWRPRRLGPGSYAPPNIEGVIEQRGELLFEANVELRTHFGGQWHGAWFIDAGNLWFTHSTRSEAGAFFDWPSSLEEVAIGMGPGARIDFSFFLLRLDLGIKVYDPALDKGDRFVLSKLNFNDLFGSGEQALLNLSINYPF